MDRSVLGVAEGLGLCRNLVPVLVVLAVVYGLGSWGRHPAVFSMREGNPYPGEKRGQAP